MALPAPHDLRPPRDLLALADLPVLDLRLRPEHPRPRAAAQGRLVGDPDPDRPPPGVLHLEPQGEELRRLDLRAPMALLADPVLAGRPAHRAGRRAGGQVGQTSLAPGAGALRPLGRVLDPVAVDPPLDRRHDGAFEALHDGPVGCGERTSTTSTRPPPGRGPG